MKTMTRQEMIEFLRGMNMKQAWLEEEKRKLKATIKTMEDVIPHIFGGKEPKMKPSPERKKTPKEKAV